MKDLLTREEFELPKEGQILTGTVISVSKSQVLVDLGSAGIGIVYPGQFYDSPDRMRQLRPGDEVSAVLAELENEDGYRELSLREAQMTTAWQRIKELKDASAVISTPILNINKGGLIVQVEGVQGFLPLSQLSSEHYPKVEGGDTAKIVQALQKFRGEEFKVKILDYNEQENKLIVSERAIQEEAAKEEIANLQVGQVVQGTVTEVTDFGAFVKLSDILDGLVHSSEIDWKFIEDPRQVLKPGQEVEAKIINLEGGRVALSIKALRPDPWLTVEEEFKPGQDIKGTVLKIRSNGAFVSLNEDIVGLIPTAEFGEAPVADTVKVGERLNLTVVSVDAKDHKLILTFREKKAESKSKEE
ncbi:MAG TPA: S1 RNA-binding domain-containing protein [Candidatus Paceibacterota bacterium]|nr:S1 RNA-binding domain-containing protein [Candidatus Paceibacterota bacterium]